MKNQKVPRCSAEEVKRDPYNYTYQQAAEALGEEAARPWFASLYRSAPDPKNQTIKVKTTYKSRDTEKYVYELSDGRCIETVFIKRRDGGTACVSTQVGCPVGCIFCESGRHGFFRNLTP